MLRACLFRTLVLVLVLGTGCGRSTRDEPRTRELRDLNAPRAGTSAVDHNFVVFSQKRLVITRLGVPVAPPVVPGSRVAADMLRSDDADTVQVDSSGMLVALRNGYTVVRSTHGEGSQLDIQVEAVGRISLAPPVMELDVGRGGLLAVMDAVSGTVLPATAGTWRSSNPGVVAVKDGQVVAGSIPGTATIEVSYGDHTAEAKVVVRGPGADFALAPPTMRMRVGEVANVQITGSARLGGAKWNSANATVVESAGSGLFQAKRPGVTRVCAQIGTRQACSQVEVKL